jgi:hypothetical protein
MDKTDVMEILYSVDDVNDLLTEVQLRYIS